MPLEGSVKSFPRIFSTDGGQSARIRQPVAQSIFFLLHLPLRYLLPLEVMVMLQARRDQTWSGGSGWNLALPFTGRSLDLCRHAGIGFLKCLDAESAFSASAVASPRLSGERRYGLGSGVGETQNLEKIQNRQVLRGSL
jgi:hypothetical protein